MPSKIAHAIIFSAFFWQLVLSEINQSMMLNGQQMMSATAFNGGEGAWDSKGHNTFENSHSMQIPGLPSPIEHQSKFQQSPGQLQHENNLNIPGMPGMHPDIHHQQFFQMQHDPNMPMPHIFDQQHLNIGPMGVGAGGMSPEQMMMMTHMAMGGADPAGMAPPMGGPPPMGDPRMQTHFQHSLNIGGPYGLQHHSQVNIFHPQPPAPPAPMPEPPSAPPAPVDGIVPWDKPTLLHEMANAYTQSCKKSDVITMGQDKKMELITTSKKMPVPLAQYEWVVDVDKVCDFLNLVPEIMHKRVDCFRIEMTPEFTKALQMHGVQVDSRVHGDLYYRYLVCDLMRKFDAEELKATRQLAVDGHKNGIIDVILDEHKRSRALPATGSWIVVLHSVQNAAFFFWEFATYLNHYHTRHFVQKEGDVCHILHTDMHFYNYYLKLTNGIDKNFDAAIQQLKGVMHAIPLDASPNQYGDENCTYDLFLLRPVLELFLALINTLKDEHHGWFKKFGHYAHSYFCPQSMPNCPYQNLLHEVSEYQQMAMANVEALKAWMIARGHGKIHEDFGEFDGRVGGKFTVHIPDPPAPKPIKYKFKVQSGDGTLVKNKIKHDPMSNVTRMTSKYYGPMGGNVVKSKSTVQNGLPYGAGGMPAHIQAQHNFHAGPEHLHAFNSVNVAGGAPAHNPMEGLGGHMPPPPQISSQHNFNAGPGGQFHSNHSLNMNGGGVPLPHPMMAGAGFGAPQMPGMDQGMGGLGGPSPPGMDIQSDMNFHGLGHSIQKRVRFNTGHTQQGAPPPMQSPMGGGINIQNQMQIGNGAGGGAPGGLNSECMFGGIAHYQAMHIVVFETGNPAC